MVPRSVAMTTRPLVQAIAEIPQPLTPILTVHAAIFAIVATDIHPR